ncbi:IclR family transcriptional regulator [Pigmentiphaga soli]|uniref:IclR family transcriptional regulator n=1 Tax=Pigmentiphaga soli TaxID=1007095 RepID=A0ABP8GGC3_9BURK
MNNYPYILSMKADAETGAAGPAAGGTQSIERAVALLRAAARTNREGATASELAAQVRLDRTTAHRILKCLAQQGLLSGAGEPRRYFLGPLAYELGAVAAERLDLRRMCRPAMTRIAEETGDTVFLLVRQGYESVCAERLEGHYPVKTFVVDVGTRRPLGIGAGSMAILGALPPDETEAAIAHNAALVGGYEGMSIERMREMAAEVRATGRSSMDVIDVEGVHAVAVPIRAPNGHAIAALSVSAIASRMSPARQQTLFGILEAEAAQLRKLLGSDAWIV